MSSLLSLFFIPKDFKFL